MIPYVVIPLLNLRKLLEVVHLPSLLQCYGIIFREILDNLTQLTVSRGKLRLYCLKEHFI